MPTYEYACASCKHEWELEQSIKEDPITECPSCHAPFNERCRLHTHLYFETEPAER